MESERKKNRFFQIAKKLSQKSDHRQHRLGCILVKGNSLIGLGFNQNKTHTKSTNEFRTLHAEVSAIVNANEEDLYGSVAYVYRETKSGALGLSKPCAACENMLRSFGIKKVYYTSPEGYKEEIYE
jgi:deoxycytidylate deaminase